MSERRYIVDDDRMERIVRKLDGCVGSTAIYASCRAFVEDLAENPIVPTHAQGQAIVDMIPDKHNVAPMGWVRIGAEEWQRRMFLAPETTIPEEIKDLIYPADQMEQYPTIQIRKECHNQQIIEAFQRGYRSAK